LGTYARSDVVLVPFPFSDLSDSKLRPALVLAAAGQGDWVCAQITSNAYADPLALPLESDDFASGGLLRTSFVRPGKLFTASEKLFRRGVGTLHSTAQSKVIEAVIAVLLTNDVSTP